jgi:hypothetical protein
MTPPFLEQEDDDRMATEEDRRNKSAPFMR